MPFWLSSNNGYKRKLIYFLFILDLYHINKKTFIDIIEKTIIKTKKSSQLVPSAIFIRKHPFYLNLDFPLETLETPSL